MTITKEQIAEMPDEIRIGHVTYTVHTDMNEIRFGSNAEGTPIETIDPGEELGATIHRSRQIWVNTDDVTLEQVQNTLLHEVLHVCLNYSGTQHALENLKASMSVEEAFVSAATTPLHGLLIDNPDLIDFLQL